MTFSKLQKKQYKEIVKAFDGKKTIMLDDKDFIRMRETLGILEVLGYIRSIEVDNTNMFQKVGDFSDFDEWHKDKEREERKSFEPPRHELFVNHQVRRSGNQREQTHT